MRRLSTIVTLALLAGASLAARPGSGDPPLSVPVEDLDAALACPDQFDSADDNEPVLLVHGTFTNSQENFSWNLIPALTADGFDVCTVELPERSMGDIQVAAEYVVHAVRTIAAASGEKVDIAGHSQGGLEPRWAVRWWPQTVRPHVDDLFMFAVPNQGTAAADGCFEMNGGGQGCFPAAWQMARVSTFIELLNSEDQTPGDISYTSLYSLTDELVQPAAPEAVAAVEGGTNILIQDVCPGRVVDHLSIVADGVAYDLLLEALTVDAPGTAGTASPDQDPTICLQGAHHGFDATAFFDADMGRQFFEDMTSGGAGWDSTDSEPEPAPYTQDADDDPWDNGNGKGPEDARG